MDVGVAIIGGGIVGVMCAAELAKRYEVVLLEKEQRLGEGASTRNSGVIHAGFYYAPGSLKAEFCVQGARILYEMCSQMDVSCVRTGKLVVAATDAGIATLETLLHRGGHNGVEGLRMIDKAELKKIEPHIDGVAALHSPVTGILDVSDLIQRCAAKSTSEGAVFLRGYAVEGIDVLSSGFRVYAKDLGSLTSRYVVNAAGLFSDDVARMVGVNSYTIHPCKGSYMRLAYAKRQLVHGLAYPAPQIGAPGLGVHFTKDVSGSVLLGPDACYVQNKDDYKVDIDEAAFLESARMLIPTLEREDIHPDYCGLRAKIVGPEEKKEQDFVIDSTSTPGMIHLIGIESPGLTASPAIAKYVRRLVEEMG